MKLSDNFSLMRILQVSLITTTLATTSCAKNIENDLVLWHDFPATDWQKHAFPIGNGTMGVMTFGGVAAEQLQFNVDSLWTGDENPDGRYETKGMGAYQNFGDVLIEFNNAKTAPTVSCPSGHKSFYAHESLEQTTDGDSNTKWCIKYHGKPVQWQISLSPEQAAAITSYSFVSAADGPVRDPQTWALSGSNDLTTWTELDRRTNEPAFTQRGLKKTFSFENGNKYRHYRFTFMPKEEVQHFQLAEICLDGITTIGPERSPAEQHYRRSLDLSTGVHRVSYLQDGVHYTREIFCSHPAGVAVMRLTAGKPGHCTGSIQLKGAHNEQIAANDNQLQFTGEFENGLKYEAQLQVLPQGGKVTSEDGRIDFKACDSLILLLAADTNYVMDYSAGWFGDHPHDQISKRLKNAASQSYTKLLEEHVSDHQSFFNRVVLDIGKTAPAISSLPTNKRIEATKTRLNDPDLQELLFQYGRYLLIGSSRPDTLPANLQGLWNNSNTPPWHSDYHTNINVQMNYWLAEPANLSECHKPFIKLTEQIIEPARKVTSKNFGTTKGFTFRTSLNIYGGQGWQWNIPASAWYCQHLWEHYAFTQDKDYLRQTAYPILKEVTEFWQQHLKKLPDGTLVVPNGWSPEHGPREDGVAHDQQIVWDLLTNTIEAATVLGVDPSFRAEMEEMKNNLLGPKIGRWGQLQEWVEDRDDPKDQHRHTSHLFAVYPGRQISVFQTPEFAKAAAISLEARGQSGDSRRSWTWPWRCAMWARLKEPQKSYNMIEGLLKYNTLPNLITTHPPLQLDGSFGITAGMCEMLLQSHTGELELLPAIPKEWPDGKVSGLKARGGFEVDIEWSAGKLTHATITANSDCTHPARYGNNVKRIQFKKGQPLSVTSDLEIR